MASDPPDSFSESSAPSLSKISLQEVQSKAFRPFMTIIMNAFRNELFQIIKGNEELALSSSLIGTLFSLLHPLQQGAKEIVGSCRNNIRFAISAKDVFICEKEEKESGFLSGAKPADQLSTFITHHRKRNPRVLSDKSLSAIQPVVDSFCFFLRESLKAATLEQFRLAIEAKYHSDISLWPPHTDSTSSPLQPSSKAGEKRKGKWREGNVAAIAIAEKKIKKTVDEEKETTG